MTDKTDKNDRLEWCKATANELVDTLYALVARRKGKTAEDDFELTPEDRSDMLSTAAIFYASTVLGHGLSPATGLDCLAFYMSQAMGLSGNRTTMSTSPTVH